MRPIPTKPIVSRPTAIVRRQESANWIDVEILNMFNIGNLPTVMKSGVKSADSGLELAVYIVLILTAIQQKSVCGYGPMGIRIRRLGARIGRF